MPKKNSTHGTRPRFVKMPWRPEDEALLKRMAEEGFVFREICEVFRGRKPDSIRSKLARMGLRVMPNRPVEPDMEAYERIRKLHRI